MHFQGNQLVSRATVVSSRALVSASAAKLATVYLGMQDQEVNVVGLVIKVSEIESVFVLVILFLILNNLLSWFGDFRSFQAWNSEKKVGGGSFIGRQGSPLRSEFENALAVLEDAIENVVDGMRRNTVTAEKASSFESQLNAAVSHVEKLRKSVDRLTLHAKLYLYGWYFAMPLAVAVWSLCAGEVPEG